MIASDRVRLDGLIMLDDEIERRFQRVRDLRDRADELRAALLVLGDARPHPQEP